VALGCALVVRFGAVATLRPAWVAGLLVFGAGAAAGIGLTSCLYFLCRLAVPGVPRLAMFIELAVFAWVVFEIVRKKIPTRKSATAAGSPFTLFAADRAADSGGYRQQCHDRRLGIESARQLGRLVHMESARRFLAAEGNLPQRAWSPALSWTHPEYPCLYRDLWARCWTYAVSDNRRSPNSDGVSAIPRARGNRQRRIRRLAQRHAGAAAGFGAAGYAGVPARSDRPVRDIPLACYFAGATIFLLLDRPLLAACSPDCLMECCPTVASDSPSRALNLLAI